MRKTTMPEEFLASESRPMDKPVDGAVFRTYTAAALDSAQFHLNYLVPKILAAKQPAILAGPRKSLKTSTALDLGLSLATGGRFLGRFQVSHEVRVGFMSGESGLGVIQETLRRIALVKETRLSEVGDRLILTERLPRFDKPADLRALEDWIHLYRLEIVFLDPAYLCMPGDGAGNLFTMGRLLGSISRVFRSTGATLVLIHHTRKNAHASRNKNPYAPPDLGDMAWAGFQEFARQWLLLGRRKQFVPGSGEHSLWMHVGGSAGHSGLWAVDVQEGPHPPEPSRVWEVKVRTCSELKSDQQREKEGVQQTKDRKCLQEDMDRIRDALARLPGSGETKSVLREKSGLRTKRFNVALDVLRKDDAVDECPVKKSNGQTYPGFKLAETSQTHRE